MLDPSTETLTIPLNQGTSLNSFQSPWGKKKQQLDLTVPLVQSDILSSSPDEVVASALLSSLDNHKQFQEQLRKGAEALRSPLKEVNESSHKFLDVLHSKGPTTIAFLINNAIL